MPARQHHRGAHPEDARLFGPDVLPALAEASADLAWLLGRGYAARAALTLVGDRLGLDTRQRVAIQRGTCSDVQAAHRRRIVRSVDAGPVAVDGFNLLITLEAALSGGVLIRGRDGWVRDLASVHGTYRSVEESTAALGLLADALREAPEVVWFLDRPVSNSGRVAERIRALGFQAEVVDSADMALVQSGWAGATADGPLLDRLNAAVDVTGPLIARLGARWLVDLQPPGPGGVPRR